MIWVQGLGHSRYSINDDVPWDLKGFQMTLLLFPHLKPAERKTQESSRDLKVTPFGMGVGGGFEGTAELLSQNGLLNTPTEFKDSHHRHTHIHTQNCRPLCLGQSNTCKLKS